MISWGGGGGGGGDLVDLAHEVLYSSAAGLSPVLPLGLSQWSLHAPSLPSASTSLHTPGYGHTSPLGKLVSGFALDQFSHW